MDRRRAGALLALAACVACSAAAPTASNQTALDLYDGAPEGCYYNFQHYGEGDRIMTNEPCLNCTCHNRMLMCYLRVCPFTKPIGQDCTVEKRADQCCPIVTCPDVPVDLLTSTSTSSPAEYGATGLGKLDKYGCSISGKYFPEGSKVPPTPNKPCEHCYCIRNMTTCVMQECTLHVDGCTPIYHKDVCCPVRYSCDHAEDEMPLLDDMSTTVRPTPGFLLTTTTISPVTQMTQDCVHDDQVFADGALIKTQKACEHCYCMKGDIVCVVQECGTPMENEGKNCTSLPPHEGQCCPDTYICEGDEFSTENPADQTTDMLLDKVTTLLPPRRSGVEGSGYRNEPDEIPYTEIPTLQTEHEGSGEEQITIKPLDATKELPSDEETPTEINVTKVTTEDEQDVLYTTISPFREPSDTSDIDEEENILPVGTMEPQEYIPGTTNVPIEKEDETTEDYQVTVEQGTLITHEHHIPSVPTTEFYSEISTDLGEKLNTVSIEKIPESHKHASSTISPTDERTTVFINDKDIESENTYTGSVGISETTESIKKLESGTENGISDIEKDTSVDGIEKITLAPEDDNILIQTDKHKESTQPEAYATSTVSILTKETEKATTELDHSQNTVDVAEDDAIQSHMQITTIKFSDDIGKGTTPQSLEVGSGEEDISGEDSFEPHEHSITAVPSREDDIAATAEPDKGVNTISGEIDFEAGPETPSTDKVIEPEVSKVTLSSDLGDDIGSTGYNPSVELTIKGDQHSITTEPSFRKEDKLSISTEKPKEAEGTTSKLDFTDEEFIPTSIQDEKLSSGTASPHIGEETTTLQTDLFTDPKEPWSKPVTEYSVLSETKPEKDSELPTEQTHQPLPESASTEKLPEITTLISEAEIDEEPGRIPGEGDCLLNGITYKNNSGVPSNNKCHSDCKCVSSIIKCDPIMCSPPPDYMGICQSIYDTPDSCCPTYVCDHPRETVPPQSDNQMSGTESPVPSPAIECRGDQCEISTETKQPMEPEISNCGSEGCDDTAQQQIDYQVPIKNLSECPDGKCEATPASCTNGDCKINEIQDQLCDEENGCKAAPAKPCDGEHCKDLDKISEHVIPQLCENDEGCKDFQTPEIPCEGVSCKSNCGANGCDTNHATPPKDTQQELCIDKHGCTPQQPAQQECKEDSCRRTEVLPIEEKLHLNTESLEQGTILPEVIEKNELTDQDKKPEITDESQTQNPQKAGEKDRSTIGLDGSITEPSPVVTEMIEEIYPVHEGSHTEIPESHVTDLQQQVTDTADIITEKQDKVLIGSTEPTVMNPEKHIKTPILQQQATPAENAGDALTTISYDKEPIETSTLLQDISPSKSTDSIEVLESTDSKPSHPPESQTIQPTTENYFDMKQDTTTSISNEETKVIDSSGHEPSSHHQFTTVHDDTESIATEFTTELNIRVTTQKSSSENTIYELNTPSEKEIITEGLDTIESEQPVTKIPESSIMTEVSRVILETTAPTTGQEVYTDIPDYELIGIKPQETLPVFIEPQEGEKTTTVPEYVTEKVIVESKLPSTEGIELTTESKLSVNEIPVYVPEEPHTSEKKQTKSPAVQDFATEVPTTSPTKPEKSITETENDLTTGKVDTTTLLPPKHFDQSTERYEPYTVQITDETSKKTYATETISTDSVTDGVTESHEIDKEATVIPELIITNQQDETDIKAPQTEVTVTEKQGTYSPIEETFDFGDLEKSTDKLDNGKKDEVTTVKEMAETATLEHMTKEPHLIITEPSIDKSHLATETPVTNISEQEEKTTEDYSAPVIEIDGEFTESPKIITTEPKESSYIPIKEITDQQESTTKYPDTEDENKIYSGIHDAESFMTDEPEIDTEVPESHTTVSEMLKEQVTKLEETDSEIITTPDSDIGISQEEHTLKPELPELFSEEHTDSDAQKPDIITIEEIQTATPQVVETLVTEKQDDIMSPTPKHPTELDTKQSPESEVTKENEFVTNISEGTKVPDIVSHEETITKSTESITESEVTGYKETITQTPEKMRPELGIPIYGEPVTEISDDTKHHKYEVTELEELLTKAPDNSAKSEDKTTIFEMQQTIAPHLLKEPTVKITGQEDLVTGPPEFMATELEGTEQGELVTKEPEGVKISEPKVTEQEETTTKIPEHTKFMESEVIQEEEMVTEAPEDSKVPPKDLTGPEEQATNAPEAAEYTTVSEYTIKTDIIGQEEPVTKTPEKYHEPESDLPSQEELVTNIPKVTSESEIVHEESVIKVPEESVTKAPEETKAPSSEQDQVINVPIDTETTRQDEPVTKVPQDTDIIRQEEPVTNADVGTTITGEEELVTKVPENTVMGQEELVTNPPEDIEINGQEEFVTLIPDDKNLIEMGVTENGEIITKIPEKTTMSPQHENAEEDISTQAPKDTKAPDVHITKQEEEFTTIHEASKLPETEETKQQEPVTEVSEYTKTLESEVTGQKEMVNKSSEKTISPNVEEITKAPEVTEILTEKVTERDEIVTETPEDTSESLVKITNLGEQTTKIPEYTKIYEISGQEETITKSPEIESDAQVTEKQIVTKTPDDIKGSEIDVSDKENIVTKAPFETKEPEIIGTGQEHMITNEVPEKTKESEVTIIEQEDMITQIPVETKEPEDVANELEKTVTKAAEPDVLITEDMITKSPEQAKEPEMVVTVQQDMVTKAPEETREPVVILTEQEGMITRTPEETLGSKIVVTEDMITKAPEEAKVPEMDVTEQQDTVTEQHDTITEAPEATHEAEAAVSGQKDAITKAPEETKEPEVLVTEQEEMVTRTPEATMVPEMVVTEQEIMITEAPEETKEPETEFTGQHDMVTKVPEKTHEFEVAVAVQGDSITKTSEETNEPEVAVTVHETITTKAPEKTKETEVVTDEQEGMVNKAPEEEKQSELDNSRRKEDATKAPLATTMTEEVTQPGEIETKAPEYLEPDVTTRQEEVSKAPEYVNEFEMEVTGHEEIVTKLPEDVMVPEADISMKDEIPKQEETMINTPDDREESETEITKAQEEVTKTPEVIIDQEVTTVPEMKVTGQEKLATKAPEDIKHEEVEIKDQDDIVTKSPEHVKESPVTEQEEIVTKVPELVEEPESTTHVEKVTEAPEETKESEPEITEHKEMVTELPNDTKEPETDVTNPISTDIVTEKQIIAIHDDGEIHKVTTEQPIDALSQTTPELIILEEHTHKALEEASTPSTSEEERITILAETEEQAPVSGAHIETVTKETELTSKADEETSTVLATTVPVTAEKVSEPVAPTVEISTDDVMDKETSIASAEPSDSEKSPISETDVVVQTEKIPPGTEKPLYTESSYDTTTIKATTEKQQAEPVSEDKFTKPEHKPSEILPTSESPKPIAAKPQPTDELPGPEEDGHFPPSGMGGYGETDYGEEDQLFGPGTCRYGGKVYVSAQQIPRDDPCDFCFCFRSDIICLQQSCPPPIHGCHEEPIQGFCCPRYECHVSMATTVNVTTTTTTTTTTLPPHFPTHSYMGAAQRRGCQIKGHTYKVGEVVRSASGPCLHCTCGGDGQMKCDPKACTPEPMLRQMIAAAVSAKRRR